MNLEEYVGKWGMPNLGKQGIHEDDRVKFEDYPFKNQWHRCVGVDTDYLVIEFSCLQIRVLEQNFKVIDPPDFLPFDNVKYVSSKGKLEIGVVVSYGLKWKPQPHKVYVLSVKGRIKSTLYEGERLTLIEDTSEVFERREHLSKMISHALRHEPDKYGLELDSKGWVEMESLIQALKQKDRDWQSVRYYDILRMIDLSEKKRHEVKTQRIDPEYKNTYRWFIRAKYGHSVEGNIYKEKIEPPEILYHGTTDKALKEILIDGLKPMERQYVHLSGEIGEAVRVGKRRQKSPRILKVRANKAFKNNVNFYRGNDQIWLSDEIAPEYIELIED